MHATNLPKLSNRAKQALDVLADGGQFVRRLERDGYTGRDKWKYRLFANGRTIIKGVGMQAFYELYHGGFIVSAPGGTSVTSPFKLNTAAA